MKQSFDVIVIGAGFYGCRIALDLKQRGYDVCILEREDDIFRRATYHNQARVHNGYHYPCSLATALRSRINFPRFIEEYRDCVESDFEQYYGVARFQSSVSAGQFWKYCKTIKAPIEEAPKRIKKLFNPDLVEDVFTVQEYVFDADKLKTVLRKQLDEAGIPVALSTEVRSVSGEDGEHSRVACHTDKGDFDAEHVFNCTYAQINSLLRASDMPAIPLKCELAEMALVRLPEELNGLAITMMCGPFFSCLPFPSKEGLHTMSHVRYTPHCRWVDRGDEHTNAYDFFDVAKKETNFPKMRSDITRFMPIMQNCKYEESLWEVKTTLMTSETDKGRPILYLPHYSLHGFTCLMGGKVDNIYDVLEHVRESLPNISTPVTAHGKA